MATFCMEQRTLAVKMSMFADNRKRVCNALKSTKGVVKRSFVLLEGGKEVSFNDTDTNYLFRQESYFQYMFGVKETDCYGVVEVATAKATLFVPRLPEEYATWMGRLLPLEEFKSMYEVDEVMYVDQLGKFFQRETPDLILTLSGPNTDSGLTSKPARFDEIEKYVVDCDILHPVIAECRVIKSPDEIEVLRYVARVSSNAHIRVMRIMKPGCTEYQGESEFLYHSYNVGGCRHVSYTCICGSGTNAAILHYGHAGAPNDKILQDGEMCLFDMGANYCGYAADITCTFPVNGKFTEDQKFIYNSVLAARDAVLEQAREGVSWVDMHKLSARVMLQKLKEGGMLKGEVDDMLSAGLPGIFQPHGLGHLLGLDVHDVGGYLPDQPERPQESWINKLRFARILKAGMYLTVEPGCYFVDSLMNKALADENLNKFINKDVFERFRTFGGVRIEDDVLITKDGNENFAIVPRTVQDIENMMTTRLDHILN